MQLRPTTFQRLARTLGALALACASAPLLAQQVKYFERPPTPEEIRAALRGGAAPAPVARAPSPSGARTRSIEWNASSTAQSPIQQTDSAVASAGGAAAFAGGGAANASSGAVAGGGGGGAIALPVNFDLGSARVSAGSVGYIQAIAQALASDPSLRLVVEGHTDGAGSPQSNMMLSWDRAFSVFRLLVERYGIDPARLQPLGKGSTEPLNASNPRDGQNRRVQFRTMG